MYCRQCGKQLEEGAAFCAYCGTKVRREQAQSASGMNTMPEKSMPPLKGAAVRPGREKKEKTTGSTAGKQRSGKGKGSILAVTAAVIVLAAAGVGGYLFLNSDGHRSGKSLKQAQEYFEAGEYEKAASCYEEALKLNAGLAEAYLGLTDIYLVDRRYEEAATLLQKGLRRTREVQEAQKTLTDKLTEVYSGGAEDLLAIPDYAQALALLEEGIQVTEDSSLEQLKENVLRMQADSQQADAPSVENPGTETPDTGTPAESEAEASSEPAGEESQYILPDSASRYLTMEDLEGLTKEECRIARNELFARHGRLFTDEELQAYFNQLDWYQGTIQPNDFDDSVFNEYEVANRDLITQFEEQQGYR